MEEAAGRRRIVMGADGEITLPDLEAVKPGNKG